VKRAALAVLCLAGCASKRSMEAPAPAEPGESFGLPAVRAPLVFPPETREVTLAWLADELARLTGQELSLSPPTRLALQNAKEALELTTDVPADEVYPFVEGLLLSQDFFVMALKDGERPILSVLESGRPGSLALGFTVLVPRERMAELRRHPALFCQLVLTFENIDSRQLQTQLRQLLVDSGGLQVVPAGERSLILKGVGTQLYNLGHLLLEVDRASATRPRPAEAPLKERS